MALAAELRQSHLGRQLASMALSQVQLDQPMAMVRAAAWCNALVSLGLHLPMFVVYDLGVLLSTPRTAVPLIIRPRLGALGRANPPTAGAAWLERYRTMLSDIAASEVAERSDDSQLAGGYAGRVPDHALTTAGACLGRERPG